MTMRSGPWRLVPELKRRSASREAPPRVRRTVRPTPLRVLAAAVVGALVLTGSALAQTIPPDPELQARAGDVAGSFSVKGMNGVYLDWRPEWKLPQPGNGYFTFMALAKKDIHVAVSPVPQTNNPMYEIVIGAWANSLTYIRRSAQGQQLGVSDKAIAQLGVWQQYWVQLDPSKRTIAVGRGAVPGNDLLLRAEDPNFVDQAAYVSFTQWATPVYYADLVLHGGSGPGTTTPGTTTSTAGMDDVSGMIVSTYRVTEDTRMQVHNPSLTYPICVIKGGTDVLVPRDQLPSASKRLIVKGTLAQPCEFDVMTSENPPAFRRMTLPAGTVFHVRGSGPLGGVVVKYSLESATNTTSAPTTQSTVAAKPQEAVLTVDALIDGVSELYVTRTQLYWKHMEFSKPGLNAGKREPTKVNGQNWQPQWSRPGETDVDQSAPYPIRLDSLDLDVIASPQNRNPVVVRRVGDAIVIRFDDPQPSDSWYSVRLVPRAQTVEAAKQLNPFRNKSSKGKIKFGGVTRRYFRSDALRAAPIPKAPLILDPWNGYEILYGTSSKKLQRAFVTIEALQCVRLSFSGTGVLSMTANRQCYDKRPDYPSQGRAEYFYPSGSSLMLVYWLLPPTPTS